MTALYAYQWPLPPVGPAAQMDPLAATLHWSHSILSERDFLSEWRAIQLASEVATDLGSSAELRTDIIALPLRKKTSSSKVSFQSTVQVLMGMDDDMEFHAVRVHHDTLFEWPDKPWRLRCSNDDGDLTSFMARRPGPRGASTTASVAPSSLTSSSSLSLPSSSPRVLWQRTVLILLDGRMVPARLSHDASDIFEHQIAQALGIVPDEVLGVHNVPTRPEDLVSQNLHWILLQIHEERRPSPFLRIVLIDLEIYEPNEILPGAFRRFSRWLPRTINRRSVFRLLDLESLLDAHGERCKLWFNNNLIAEDFFEPLHLEDGDYLRILIGEHDSDFQCDETTEDSEDFIVGLQLSASMTGVGSSLALPADADPLLFMKLCSTEGHRHPHLPISMSVDEETDPPAGHLQGHVDPLQGAYDRPPGIDQPVWVHEVWDLLVAHGAVEFAEEGPIIYLRSHYISHRHHKANRVSRPLRFDTDFETWEADVRFMWEDLADATALDLVFIAPEPASSPTAGTCGTVLVIQHPSPGQAACLVTHPGIGDHSTHNEIALSLATPCTSETLLHSAELASFCTQQELRFFVVCELLVGSIVHERDQLLRIHDGLGLRVRLQNLHASELVQSVNQLRAAEEDDNVQLWTHQWSIHLHGAQKSRLQRQAHELQDCLASSSSP